MSLRRSWYHCSQLHREQSWVAERRAPQIRGSSEPDTPRLCRCPLPLLNSRTTTVTAACTRTRSRIEGRSVSGIPTSLYRIVAGVLPIERRCVLIRFADGATWCVPASRACRLEAQYMERNAETYADEASDDDERNEILSRTAGQWYEWCVLNGDAEHAVLAERWDIVRATHLCGPKSVVPGNDRIWWVGENGGSIEELTDLTPSQQRRIARHYFDRRPGIAADGRGKCDSSVPAWRVAS